MENDNDSVPSSQSANKTTALSQRADGLPDELATAIGETNPNDKASSSTSSSSVAKSPTSSLLADSRLSCNSSQQSSTNNLSTKIPGQNLIYRPPNDIDQQRSLPAVVPHGKIFNLIPRLISTNRTSSGAASGHNTIAPLIVQGRNRKPKFVPFEPYKAAISPLMQTPKTPHLIHAVAKLSPTTNQSTTSRNNLDLNTLVQHISVTTTAATTATTPDQHHAPPFSVASALDQHERQLYDSQLAGVRIERDQIAAQLKSQVQVNAELKHLLVAAVGEDLQTRVNVLTEDKLQLARALLSTAANLSSHTEQIEYLAGQSEVWRSKFLASSLMVEELARWKASLQSRNAELGTVTSELLQTMTAVRQMGVETLANVRFVSGQQQREALTLRSGGVLDVLAECVAVTQKLVLHSEEGGMPARLDLCELGLDARTDVERRAVQVLQNEAKMAQMAISGAGCSGSGNGMATLQQTDEAMRAVVGQAFPVDGKRFASVPTEKLTDGERGGGGMKNVDEVAK